MKERQEVASGGKRAKGRLFGVFLALMIVAVVIIASYISSMESRKTVAVLRVKAGGDGLTVDSLLTDSNTERYDMYYKEFKQCGTITLADGGEKAAIVLWDDRASVIGKRYAGYYIREGTPVYWDQTVREQTKSNSYLYSMKGELLNIQLDTSDFGLMVVPGDVINVRATYTDTVYNLPTEDAFKLSLDGGASVEGIEVQKTVKLFNEIPILDMLNSDNESIFDIYYNYISLSSAEREALRSDEDFLKSIEAKSILVEVTAERAEQYAEISSKGPTYLMTLCPRTGSNAIIDSLSELQELKTSGK